MPVYELKPPPRNLLTVQSLHIALKMLLLYVEQSTSILQKSNLSWIQTKNLLVTCRLQWSQAFTFLKQQTVLKRKVLQYWDSPLPLSPLLVTKLPLYLKPKSKLPLTIQIRNLSIFYLELYWQRNMDQGPKQKQF